jgi:hypothetical protein
MAALPGSWSDFIVENDDVVVFFACRSYLRGPEVIAPTVRTIFTVWFDLASSEMKVSNMKQMMCNECEYDLRH